MKSFTTLTGFVLGVVVAVLFGGVSAGSAVASGPAIRVSALAPDYVTPDQYAMVFVSVINVGDAPLSGDMTLKYTLPVGMPIFDPINGRENLPPAPTCTQAGQVNECVVDMTGVPAGRSTEYQIYSLVDPSATGTLAGQIEVSGAGAGQNVTVPLVFRVEPLNVFDIKALNIALTDNPILHPAQAGSAPTDVTTSVELLAAAKSNFGRLPVPDLTIVSPPESFREVVVHVPAGMVGNPTATPQHCTVAQLNTRNLASQVPICPRDSQIGLALVNGKDIVPVYNLVPPKGAPAEFGFYYQGLIVNLRARVRPSDHGIDIVTPRAPSSAPIPKFEVTLWGVPADGRYDTIRADCTFGLHGASGQLCPTQAPRVPFLRTPTSCSGAPLPWSIDIDTYQHPGVLHHRDATSPALTGCEQTPFEPAFSLAPSTKAARSPSGVDATLTLPQEVGVNGIAEADLHSATVTLPDGMTINPSSADGLAACADNQLNLGQDTAASCPDASKIGTVTVDTPLLADPVQGSIFLRSQASDDPASGELFRIAVELRSDDRGVDIKLPAAIKVDPTTGRLSTVFDDLPQLPFSSMQLHFKTGPRAPLVSPGCGTHAVSSQMVGWNGATVSPDNTFSIDQGCPTGRFSPALVAGSEDSAAAASSTFHLKVTREDGDQEIKSIATTLPKGLLAHIGDVPEGGQIGHVTVGAGAGPDPFYLTTGKVFLTGPYKGAPFGLDIQVPVVAGPFDLGVVDVKAALNVDPITAQATVVADPMPRFVKGVPVLARDIRVTIDRPGFMVNPTSCVQQQISSSINSFDNATATPSTPFRAVDCGDLALKPKLAIALTGKGQTTDGKHPGVAATVTQTGGQSNLHKVRVALPLSLALDPDNANGLCEFVDGSKVEPTCPKASIVGTATARTPLLAQPLTGPVYFVKNIRKDPKSGREIRTLPKLVLPLTGQNGLRLTLTGTSDVEHNQLVTTFDNIPDAPVSSFKLNIIGGKGGILAVSGTDICKAAQVADQQIDGQNGKAADADVYLQTPACPLKIISKKVGKTSVAVKVGGLGAGKVTVSGRGIKKTTKTIAKSTVATITAKRTKGKPGKVTVSFDPTGPAKAHKTTK